MTLIVDCCRYHSFNEVVLGLTLQPSRSKALVTTLQAKPLEHNNNGAGVIIVICATTNVNEYPGTRSKQNKQAITTQFWC